MLVSILRCLPLAAAFAGAISTPTSAAIYRVGGGGGCSHATIQAAVNAAGGNAGADTIRITRTLSYSNQNVIIQNDTSSLRLEGGWADCQASATTPEKTVVSGAGGNTDAVFSLRGTGDVSLLNLEISGGDQDDGGGGGGIEILGGPKNVVLTDMLIRGNRAGYGGGISVVNTATGNSADVQLVLYGNTSIDNNTALNQVAAQGGGGIYCRGASVKVYGGAYLLLNRSNSRGGGIRADDCQVEIGSTGLLGGVLLLNSAALDGGGLSASGERSVVTIFTVDPASPATVLSNTAGGLGGGIFLYEDAQVSVYDAIVSNNTASRGGGVALFDSSATATATRFLMQGTTVGAPASAQNCAERERCNRISNNIAHSGGGVAQEGAALYLYGNSLFGTIATLRGTRINANDGKSVLAMNGTGDAALDGTLIEGNTASAALFDTPGQSHNLILAATTIANNTIGIGQPVIRANSTCAIVAQGYRGTHVYRSIVWQPGRSLLTASATPDLDCYQYLLGNDLTALPPSTLNRIGDPLFRNPSLGDFRLDTGSPALDYAVAQTANSTRDRNARVIDIPGIANEFGPHDLGAYEIDSIFSDGFE